MPWPTRRSALLAAAPGLTVLAASLAWALYDRLTHPLWLVKETR